MPAREITPKSHAVSGQLTRSTTTGVVPKGAITVSFMNTGGADATVQGTVLAAGESVTFPEIIGSVYREFSYSGTGTTLVIQESR